MTHLERCAVALATEKPAKVTKTSHYLNKAEDHAREVVQPMPREIKHRDQLPVMRRLDATNNDEIPGEIGAKLLAALRRKGISTSPIRRRETTDNIGRAVWFSFTSPSTPEA